MKKIITLLFLTSALSVFSVDVWEKKVFAEISFPFSVQEEGVNWDGFEINAFFDGVGFGGTFLFFKPQPVFAFNMQYLIQFPERTIASYFNPVLQLRMGLLRDDIGIAFGAGGKCFLEFAESDYLIFAASAFYEMSFEDSGLGIELTPALGGKTFESILTFGGSIGGRYVLE